jgi:small subunit ribosomal protein S5
MAYSQTLEKNNPLERQYEEKVVQVSRVSKKTKGGNQFGFSILVVVGDKKGKVGVGLGKGKDVLSSIKKAVKKAKKNLISVPMDGTTIPFPMRVKDGAAKVLLKPAPKGSGVIAGGAVRSVVEAAGIRDLSAKILGTGNQASNVYATFDALKQMEKLVKLKGIKLKSIVEVEAEEAKKLEKLAEKAPAKLETADKTPKATGKPQQGQRGEKRGAVVKKAVVPTKNKAEKKS